MKKIKTNLYPFYLFVYFCLLATPLISIPPALEPPAWGQAIVFRSLFAVLFFILIVRNEIDFKKIKNYLQISSPVFFPLSCLLIYFGFYVISTLFSLDIHKSLWSTPERGGGGLVNFSFFFLFFLTTFLFIKKEDYPKLLNFSLFIAFLIVLLAYFQKFKILSIFLIPEERTSATLGNPILFNHFLIPFFFISLSLFFIERRIIKKYFYLSISLLVSFALIFLGHGRAGFLGLTIGILWFFFTLPFPSENPLIKRRLILLKIIVLILILVIIGLIFFFAQKPSLYQKWSPFFKEPIWRLTSLTKGIQADASRISAWKIGIRASLERPWLGYGPENFIIAFYRHYDPLLPQIKLANFDKAHNFLIENLVASGIFALFFYLLFIFSLLLKLQKIKKNFPLAHGIQSGLIAYFIVALFSIEETAHFLILFFLVSYSFHLIIQASQPQELKEAKKSLFPQKTNPLRILFFSFLFLGLILFLWQYNLLPLKVNSKINLAQYLISKEFGERWDESFKILEKESKRKTILTPYLNSFCINQLIYKIYSNQKKDKALIERLIMIAQKNTQIQPSSAYNWLRLGEGLTMLAEMTNDQEKIKEAQQVFQKALSLSPKNEVFLQSAFSADIIIKDFEAAKKKTDFCLKNFPQVPECLWISGLLNIYLNNIKKGEEFIEKAKKQGYFSSSQLPKLEAIPKEVSLNQLVKAYAENKNYEKLIPLYQELIQLSPNEPQYWASLAFVYKELKNYQKAKETAQKLIELLPESKPQVEDFLKNLPK